MFFLWLLFEIIIFWAFLSLLMLFFKGIKEEEKEGKEGHAAVAAVIREYGIFHMVIAPILLLIFGIGGFFWSIGTTFGLGFLVFFGSIMGAAVVEKFHSMRDRRRTYRDRVDRLNDECAEVRDLLRNLDVDLRAEEFDTLVLSLREQRQVLQDEGVLPSADEMARGLEIERISTRIERAMDDLGSAIRHSANEQADAIRSLKGSNKPSFGFAVFSMHVTRLFLTTIPMFVISFFFLFALTDYKDESRFRVQIQECVRVWYPGDQARQNHEINEAMDTLGESGAGRFIFNFAADLTGCKALQNEGS